MNYARIAGISYIIIFVTAIYANFFVLEAIKSDYTQAATGFGILAFLITVVFDVVVAWALYELYKKHYLSTLSTLFRMMHAVIFGAGIFALMFIPSATSVQEATHYLSMFNYLWLIGLFFFGIHLILLAKILVNPKILTILLAIAGVMYMIDTCANFLLSNYNPAVFLPLVAIPSIVGEMGLAIWLIVKNPQAK